METLGAYLLRSGVLNKDTLAAALDRQVVYGGWLDTALLELGLLDEPRVADLLSAWSGYPVCARGWLEMADANVVATLPQHLAVTHVVVPFAVSPEGVWVATPAPVDVDALAQLAAAMGQPVLPHVSTEYRIRLALRMHYGVPLDARFDELASYLLSRQIPHEAESARPPVPAPSATMATSDGAGVVVEQPGFGGEVILPAQEPAPAPAPPPVDEPEPVGALDLTEALAFLAAANDRDAIVNIAVRYALQAFPFVAFLGILRGQAVVWQARAHAGELPADPGALKGIRLPLDERSPLRTVVETRAPSLGSAAHARAGQNLSEKLGRKVPRAMLLLPILVGGRVVGVLYADHGDWAIRTQQVSEVMAFCARVGPAFENLIRERRTRTEREHQSRPPEPPPPVEQPMAVVEAAAEALAAQPKEAWVVDEHRLPSTEDALPPPETTPVQQQWVVASPAEVQTPASMKVPEAAPPPVEEPPPPVEEPAPQLREDVPDEDEDEDEEPVNGHSEEPIELETPPTPLPTPSRTLSPEAAALAAAALARAQAGDDDEDEDEEDASPETPLTADTSWSAAMTDALSAKESNIGKFETKADWQTDLANAAASVPVVAPATDEEDEEEAKPKPGEEAVVFSEIQDTSSAQVNAFTNALTETIASGKQGGETVEAGWKAFADKAPSDEDDDEEEPSNAGWESVVLDAAAQVEAAQARQQQAAPAESDIASAVEDAARTHRTPTPIATPAPTPPAPPQPEPPTEPVLIDPPRVWVEALVSGVPDRVVAAQQKLMELGPVAMPALAAAFPGRVQWDPFGADAQTPEPSQVSALVDVVARMGVIGLQAAVPHLDSKFPAHRYFATLLLARVYQPNSIPYLLRRLHDDEPRIRKLAGDALAAYVAEPGFEQVLRHLRTRISSVVPEGRRRAIHFLGRFRDVGSIPALINALRGKEAEIVQEAAQALHAITLQSLGTSERKWSAWWEKNKHRSRIEWLIDALKDSDVEVRARAGSELAQLTRDTFGFKADGPRKDREAAVKRWERWWADERRRLVGSPA